MEPGKRGTRGQRLQFKKTCAASHRKPSGTLYQLSGAIQPPTAGGAPRAPRGAAQRAICLCLQAAAFRAAARLSLHRRRTSKTWPIFAMEYYSALKRKEILPPATCHHLDQP